MRGTVLKRWVEEVGGRKWKKKVQRNGGEELGGRRGKKYIESESE